MAIKHTKTATLPDCPAFCVGSGEWNDCHVIDNCTVTNAQLAGCITFAKLATLTAGNILVGNMCNVTASVNPSGDVDISCTGAFTISNCAVSNAKLANMVTARIKGRTTACTGDPEDLTAAQVRTVINVECGSTADQTDAQIKTAYEANACTNEFSCAEQTTLSNQSGTNTGDEPAASTTVAGISEIATAAEVNTGTDNVRSISPLALECSTLSSDVTTNNAKVTNATHTGCVTGSVGLTIATNSVTNARLADMVTARMKGRVTACTGDPEDLTSAQVRTFINVECGSTADQTNAQIKTAYEANTCTNEFDDAEQTKLAGIETAAKDDQAIAELTDVTVMCLTNCDVIKRVGCAWINSPDAGAGCGICAVVCDTSPCLGGDLSVGTNSIIFNSNDASPPAGTVMAIYRENCDLNSNVSACDIHIWRVNDVVEMTLSAAALCIQGNLTLTGTVDGIDIATDVAANTSKVTNATHTGCVTGCGALTIIANAVTNARLADMAVNTIKGRITACTGNPEDLTATQTRTLINVECGSTADQTNAEIKTAYEANACTNEFSDTEQTNLGNQSGTNTGDEPVASLTVSGTVELATIAEVNTGTDATRAVTPDSLEGSTLQTNVTTNNSKVTNATHTGCVTGSCALTIACNAVTLAHMAGGTDGNIITYNACGNPAFVTTGCCGQVLTSNGVGTAPTFQCSAGGNHNLLSTTHSDSTTDAVTRGSIVVGNSTPAWDELVIGTCGQVLTTDACGDAVWSCAGGGGGIRTNVLRMVPEVPEGTIAFPCIRTYSTAVNKISGHIFPDGACEGQVNYKVIIPQCLAGTPNAKIRLHIAATAAGTTCCQTTRWETRTLARADGESLDIAMTTDCAGVNLTMGTAADLLQVLTVCICATPTAGDELLVQIKRKSNVAADDYAQDAFIIGVFLLIDVVETSTAVTFTEHIPLELSNWVVICVVSVA